MRFDALTGLHVDLHRVELQGNHAAGEQRVSHPSLAHRSAQFEPSVFTADSPAILHRRQRTRTVAPR
jgi:hypothetical protein